MKIVVCIKQVPNTNEVRIDPATGTMIRDGVESIMNPDDKAGLEEALVLKDQLGAEVTVITMGPLQADIMLREALAMGADKAVLLTDRKFAGADTWATSSALTSALNKLQADIIITGRQAIDGDTAQVGPQIAEHMGLPQISYVQKIETKDGKNFTVTRATEDGYQVLEVQAPCLFTLLSDANEPRYMRVKGIVEAYDKEVEIWTAETTGVDEATVGLKGSPTKVFKSFTKEAKGKGEVHEVTPSEAAKMIIAKLQEKFII